MHPFGESHELPSPHCHRHRRKPRAWPQHCAQPGEARCPLDLHLPLQSRRGRKGRGARARGSAQAIALQLDTGDVGAFDDFVGRVREALSRLDAERFDYLVNNAGISHHNSFDKTTEAELDDLYNVHFKGVFFLTQKLLPLMNDERRIVNLSTGLTRITIPGSAPYASMKGAVEVLTRYLAKELGPRRIAVNTVAPGAIATDFSGGMVRDNPEMNKRVSGMTALGRAGVPDDIGPMIAGLLSEDDRWINAQRIEVSGGMAL